MHQKDGKNALRNSGPVFEIDANVGTAFASRSLKAASSNLPEAISYCHMEKRIYLGKVV